MRFLVHGRVQGVGFRWFVAATAERLGLTGYAENLPGGAVEVVAVGDPDAVEAMGTALEEGPRLARVSHVERSQILDEINRYTSFHIR